MQKSILIKRCVVLRQILLRASHARKLVYTKLQDGQILKTDMINIISHYCPVELLLRKKVVKVTYISL